MILPLLLALGPLGGIALVFNNPEEIIPGRKTFAVGSMIGIFLAEVMLLSLVFYPQAFLSKTLVLFGPFVAGVILWKITPTYDRLIHLTFLWGALAYTGLTSVTLTAAIIIGSFLTLCYMAMDCVHKDQVREKQLVWQKGALFLVPFGVALFLSFF